MKRKLFSICIMILISISCIRKNVEPTNVLGELNLCRENNAILIERLEECQNLLNECIVSGDALLLCP